MRVTQSQAESPVSLDSLKEAPPGFGRSGYSGPAGRCWRPAPKLRETSHGRQLGFDSRPPQGVTLHWAGRGDLSRMLQAGELDACFPAGGSPIDTTSGPVTRLFPDRGRQFTADYFRQTGYLPVNHAVLVQRRLAEKEPWAVLALLDAFEDAKREAYRRDWRSRGAFRDANEDIAWQAGEFGDDPFPYGLAANRAMLTTAARQSNRDGLTERAWDFASCVPQELRLA